MSVDVTQHRSRFIGGSDVPAILGLCKYRTPMDVWAEKTGRTERADAGLAARVGSMLEPLVLDLYREDTGYTVEEPSQPYFDELHVIRGHLDGVVHPPQGRLDTEPRVVVEAKTVGDRALANATNVDGSPAWSLDDGVIPHAYRAQVLTYMGLLQTTTADVAVLGGNHTFRVLRVHATDKQLRQHIGRLQDWWTDYVLADTPPPERMRPADYVYLDVEPGSAAVADDETIELIDSIRRRQSRLRRLSERLDEQRDRLRMAIGDNERLLDHNQKELATWKRQTRKSYTVPEATTRVLRLKSPKT